jgi:hypothetical protein
LELAPDDEIGLWTTKQRIKMFKKEGVDLEVYKRLTTKEAQKKKEKEFEKMIKEKTKGIDPCTAYRYKARLWSEMYEEKKQPDWENEVTMKLIETHLKEEEEEIEHTKSVKWKNFKEMGKKLGIHNMKRKVQKWLGREKSDIREKIEEIRRKYTKKLEEHKKIISKIKEVERKNQNVEERRNRIGSIQETNYKRSAIEKRKGSRKNDQGKNKRNGSMHSV